MKKIRCAIYTRKSSEEGLQQDFNSLDAQREACAAYVLSQASEGWSLLPDLYDDGGLSGGTLERPALQRLLADVAEGRIDTIVVYKVDRLTRSLLDFSKLVEAFDAANTSFVSITQSFNTTTSMGRLTLNMLLSFAQFEREVTAERIRDKIAASKAKGMWMGGTPPLGYRPDGRSLAIVEEHAELIRDLYRRYLEMGTVSALAAALVRERVLTPVRHTSAGKPLGGCQFSRGQLYTLLRNPIYVGEIRHDGRTYPGLHKPIVPRELWDEAQRRLTDNTQGKRSGARAERPSILAGLITDEAGDALIASHATKGKTRYRYYVSHPNASDRDTSAPIRIPAREIESAVIDMIATALEDPLPLIAQASLPFDARDIQRISTVGHGLAAKVRASDRNVISNLLGAVQVMKDKVEVRLIPDSLASVFGLERSESPTPAIITAPMRLTRTGHAVRLIQTNGRSPVPPEINMPLVKLIDQAQRWWARLAVGDITNGELAAQEGVATSYMSRVVRLAFLSPAIVETILAGEQRASVAAGKLRRTIDLPLRWGDQEVLIG